MEIEKTAKKLLLGYKCNTCYYFYKNKCIVVRTEKEKLESQNRKTCEDWLDECIY